MFATGSPVEIIKHAPESGKLTQYSGRVIPAQAGWVAARCDWVHGYVDLGALKFRPGDVLDEYFALDEPFNAFAVLRSSGEVEGWYCNVTRPTRIEGNTIHWHDLYIDLLVTRGDGLVVLDEDELAESNLEQSDPELHRMILTARDQLIELAQANAYPFSEHPV